MGTLISASSYSTTGMGKIILRVEGKSLPKMDLLSKSDPYLCVFIATESNAYKFVTRTEFIKNNCNPVWKPLEVEDEELDVSNDDTKFKLEVLDYDGKKKAEHMCSAVSTLGELRTGGTIQLEDRERRKKGTLNVTGWEIVQ